MVARCSTRRNKRRTTHNSGTIGKTRKRNKKRTRKKKIRENEREKEETL